MTSLAAILRRDPREFVARVAAIAEGRLEPLRVARPRYDPIGWNDVIGGLAQVLGPRVRVALEERALAEVEERVRAGIRGLLGRAPYTLAHNADLDLARCCYAICRALEPRTVVETGVGYGVTTAFLLRALAENGEGVLHSIDLPPLEKGAEGCAGVLVPEELRGRWRLHRGMSRKLLPGLLEAVERVDLFVHDSMHTLENMRFELGAVWPKLAPGGAVLADDVEGNAAFAKLAGERPAFHAVVRQAEKPALFGVAVK